MNRKERLEEVTIRLLQHEELNESARHRQEIIDKLEKTFRTINISFNLLFFMEEF